MSARLTHKALAKELHCAERTVERWSEREDWPTNGTLAEIRAYLAANGLGRDPTKTKTQLQEEKLREEIDLLRLKKQREEGKTVSVAEVREMLGQMAARHALLLRTKYDTELPARLMGKDVVAMRAEIVATTDEVSEVVNAGLTQWNPAS